MRYLGGKSRFTAFLQPLLTLPGRTRYIEPFTGGASVLTVMAPTYQMVEAGDAHPDLVALWNAVLSGWTPPELIDEATYAVLRDSPTSPERGYAGFACSFGGKWFGGYARKSDGTPDQASSRASLLRKAAAIRPHCAQLRLVSYTEYEPGPDSVVYCDPPYVTSAVYASGVWRPYDFWDTVREWVAAGAAVAVSEFQAPNDFVEVGSTAKSVAIERTSATRTTTQERLFVHGSQRDVFLSKAARDGALF